MNKRLRRGTGAGLGGHGHGRLRRGGDRIADDAGALAGRGDERRERGLFKLWVPKTCAAWAGVLHLAVDPVPCLVLGQVGSADPAEATDSEVREIAGHFLEVARSGASRAQDLAALHEALSSRTAVGIADRLVAALRDRRPSREALRRVARMLVMAGSRREAVKAGIVALGTCGDERDRDLLVVLGSLEEFTLFAVVAMMSTQPDRERAVFDVARRVTGWGRIHAVEQLASTADPEIQAWLLRDGFRNDVMYEYLACIAATTGCLYEALLDPAADQELVTSAGEILATLSFLGGPAKDMRHYPDAVPAMHRFAELAADCDPTLRLLDSLLTIRNFVTRAPEFDWPDGEPARLSARYTQLLARPS